jgi:hypothetical protein
MRFRRLAFVVVPSLLLFTACGETSVSPSGTESPSPLAVASAAPDAVATLAPTALASVAPQDPYAAATTACATAVCADGTWSYSQNRSGTCSHHGGVHWWTGNLGPAGTGAH